MADQREPVLEYETRLADLLATYAEAQRALAAQVQAAVLAGDLGRAGQRRLQLAAVLAALDQLGAATDPAARRLVRDAYTQGAARTAEQVAGLAIEAPEVPGAFTGVSTETVQALEDSILDRLDGARQTVGRSVNDTYARAGRRAAVRAVLGADGSPAAASRALRKDLMADGLTGFVDRAGKRWALDTYSTMAVRTVTREAVVQGSIDRMASHGIDLARVSVHASSCTICKPYEGKLVSLDSATRDFMGEAVMDAARVPPFHPNCRHTLQPVASRIEAIRRELNAATP